MSLSAALKLPCSSMRTCFARCLVCVDADWVDWEDFLQHYFTNSLLILASNGSHVASIFYYATRRSANRRVYLGRRERNTKRGRAGLAGFHGWTVQSVPVRTVPSLANLLIALFPLAEAVSSSLFCRVLQVKHQHSHIGGSNSANATGLCKAQRADTRKFFPGLGP